MASICVRESSFCDKAHNDTISQILYNQKQSAIFCDVVMKVCDREIFAHSNVLAAASPYFGSFLSQDLPRQFSQRAPQVIEIQIDGSEPNVLYEEAVGAVIDYIYTGKMLVKDTNVFQISEIARIMQIDTIVQFCEDFSVGKVGASELWEVLRAKAFPTKTRSDAAVNTDRGEVHGSCEMGASRLKSKKLVSVSTQVLPQLLGMKCDKVQTMDKSTSTSSNVGVAPVRVKAKAHLPKKEPCQLNAPKARRGRPRKQKPTEKSIESVSCHDDCGADGFQEFPTSEKEQHIYTVAMQPSGTSLISSLTDGETFQIIETLFASEQERTGAECNAPARDTKERLSPECVGLETEMHPNTECTSSETAEKTVTVVEKVDSKPETSEVVGMRRSRRTPKPTPKMAMASPKRRLSLSRGMPQTTKRDAEKVNTAERKPTKADRIKIELQPEGETMLKDSSLEESFPCSNSDENDPDLSQEMMFLPGKYQCDSCDFTTNRVREMTNHKKLHKFALNTCYYCDQHFDSREVLNGHIVKHKGPMPFFCPTCDTRFRTRTQLNLHLPKHSKEKPFICEVCSMGFKWKHALKNHMITHSNKKDHLCDVCGYATAHKSQLKAHRLIHSGNTFRCPHAECTFQATKRQNLKYHMLTHTREKPHQCEICGQSFSLVKNMRRHMMLHQTEKPHRCDECDFSTTRYDKLKEHMLKQHGLGSPPEKRVRITDLVTQYTIEPSKHMEDIKYELPVDDAAAVLTQGDIQPVQIVPNQTIIIAQPAGTTAEAALQMAQLGEMTVIVSEPNVRVIGEDDAGAQMMNGVQSIANNQYQTVQYTEVMIPASEVAGLVQQVSVSGYVTQ